jgi:ubiquinone/menaquinone biosynthesis C-methylase UbiE
VSQTDHFDSVAARYDRLRAPLDVTPVHELLAREGGLPGKRVLDIGCGTGAHALIFVERFGCSVSGVDASAGMVAQARAKLPGGEVRQGLAEELPFGDRSFDAALMMLVVHHLDRPHAFGEAARVLVPGGRLLITTSNPDAFSQFWLAPLFPSYVETEQARFPSFDALDADLRAAGFGSVRRIDHTVLRSFSKAEALAKLRGRHASTFDLFDQEEYAAGVARGERELPDPVEYSLDLIVVVAST